MPALVSGLSTLDSPASGLSFSLFLLFSSVAIAQPPTIVDVYSGGGGTVIYLDSPFDPATDRLCSQLPMPWRERSGVPDTYNNQPDGEGSVQPITHRKPTAVAIFGGGHGLHTTGNPIAALGVERAGVRSKLYCAARPRIYGIHGRRTWPGGNLYMWGHRFGPMEIRVNDGGQNRFVDCEWQGLVRFNVGSRFNVLDGITINNPMLSGRNQFTYRPVEQELAKGSSPRVMESLGTGNAILRGAVVRPGGMVAQEGFDLVTDLKVVGD